MYGHIAGALERNTPSSARTVWFVCVAARHYLVSSQLRSRFEDFCLIAGAGGALIFMYRRIGTKLARRVVYTISICQPLSKSAVRNSDETRSWFAARHNNAAGRDMAT